MPPFPTTCPHSPKMSHFFTPTFTPPSPYASSASRSSSGRLLKLDLVVRDEQGNILNPDLTSAVKLYRHHQQAASRSQHSEVRPESASVPGPGGGGVVSVPLNVARDSGRGAERSSVVVY